MIVHRLGSVSLVGLALVVSACSGSTSSGRAPLSPDSSCEDRYWYATNSPAAQEYGTEGILPKDEWIANCEAGG